MSGYEELAKVKSPKAITAKTIDGVLDQLNQRFGGKPFPKLKPGEVVLPPIGRRRCEGQLDMYEDEAGEQDS